MILLTGGSGLLGKELQKYLHCYTPTHKELDITKKIKPMKDISMVIHCAAYTDVVKAEKEQEKCYQVNVIGTKNLLEAYPRTPFVYISSEYAENPVNYYALSKLTAEKFVTNRYKTLIIRTSFSPRPFPHKYAFFDQYTLGDYVDVIAPMIIRTIADNDWDHITCKEVGTTRKTILELARETKPRIKGISVRDITNVQLPYDYR